jgi:hypothetical protein
MVKCLRTWFPNPLGEGKWSDVMRRQGVTPVCNGPVCSVLQGTQRVSSSADIEKSRLPTTV